ncbi:MAG: UPF0175 family protein [Ardenticatenales bacterium]|nr:UPF0175 family protein [Ardenticatenales bacterium]
MRLTLQFPDELLETLGETDASFQELAQELLLAKLYELGRITSSLAAQSLGISRREFLERIGQYQVSLFEEQSAAGLDEEATLG